MSRPRQGSSQQETPRLDALLATHDGFFIRLGLVDIAGDLASGALLSQLVYWHPRLTIEREGHLWLAKTRGDWWDECRLTEMQVRRAISQLEGRGLIVKAIWKWRDAPTTHLRLVPEVIEAELSNLPPPRGDHSIRVKHPDPVPGETPGTIRGNPPDQSGGDAQNDPGETPDSSSLHTETTDRDYKHTPAGAGVVAGVEGSSPVAQKVPTLFGLEAVPRRLDEEASTVFEEWVRVTERTGRTRLDEKRRTLIEAALRDYPLEDCLDAVRGWRRSGFHCGENPEHRVHNDLRLLLRDAEHLERFRDLERSGPGARRPGNRNPSNGTIGTFDQAGEVAL